MEFEHYLLRPAQADLSGLPDHLITLLLLLLTPSRKNKKNQRRPPTGASRECLRWLFGRDSGPARIRCSASRLPTGSRPDFQEHTPRHSTTPKNTHSSETAAGFSPPPSTLTTGTLSHTQTFTSSSEVVTAYGGYAVTSIRTMRSPIDRSTAKESSFERALTGTNPTFDPQRKNQTVRASIRVCA